MEKKTFKTCGGVLLFYPHYCETTSLDAIVTMQSFHMVSICFYYLLDPWHDPFDVPRRCKHIYLDRLESRPDIAGRSSTQDAFECFRPTPILRTFLNTVIWPRKTHTLCRRMRCGKHG